MDDEADDVEDGDDIDVVFTKTKYDKIPRMVNSI